MTLRFGDMLSNAIHDIKRHTGKKISVLQDEIGYTFEPDLTGDTIESWRYRKRPPTMVHLEQLAKALIAYKCAALDRAWLSDFLSSADHPYPAAICDRLFPETAESVPQPLAMTFPPPPATSYKPPHVEGFIGRTSELERYEQQLREDGVAIVAGMAGVGKTSLASILAQAHGEDLPIFWHSFYDNDLSMMIRRLAGFLAGQGRAELWEAYESARTSGTRPPDAATSFDTLLAHLEGVQVLLCLDDLQFVDDNPHLQNFLQRVVGDIDINARVLVTSRRIPSFLSQHKAAELGGLSLQDTADLLVARGVNLPTDELHRLRGVTDGNGAFLTLGAVVLRQTRNASALIEELATVDDIERFLMQEVNDRLGAGEQRVMEAVAVLCGYPGSRDVLETMLNQRDLRRSLRELCDQYLLTVHRGEEETEYSQHQIVQSFYYEQPTRKSRRTYHQRAGEYYAEETTDAYKAVLHFTKGDLAARAVQIGHEELWPIVNLGQGRSLFTLVEELLTARLDREHRLRALLMHGQLGAFLGEYEGARVSLEEADRYVDETLDQEEVKRLQAQVCLAMAKVLERSAPPEALEWAYRGLDAAPLEDKQLLAALKIQAGTISLYMGNLGGAMETLHDGLDDLDGVDDGSLRIAGSKSLGWTNFLAGQLQEAQQYTDAALRSSKTRRDHYQTAEIYINKGPIEYVSGNWKGAVSALEEGLAIAQRLGSHDAITALHVNLGGCYTTMGKDEEAFYHLNQVLTLTRESRSMHFIIAHIRLAQLHNLNGAPDSALDVLRVAHQEAEEKNDQISLHTILGYQGQAHLLKGNQRTAVELTERAIRGLRALGDSMNEGYFWRLRGQIAAEANDHELAAEAFATSQELLQKNDEYQAAVTLLEWAKINLRQGQPDVALRQIEQSKEVFSRLDAHRELNGIEQLEASLLSSNLVS